MTNLSPNKVFVLAQIFLIISGFLMNVAEVAPKTRSVLKVIVGALLIVYFGAVGYWLYHTLLLIR